MIETISNEDMRDILSMGRDMADLAGKAGKDKQNPGISRVEATVTAVNGDGSLTVNLGSATKQILRTFKMTSACYGAQVGDRVIVDTLNHISYITGILARDNGHYVTGDLDLRACSAYNSGFPPRYTVAGGVLMLSGRITSPYINAEICDLSGLVHPSAIPPSNVNRSIPCLMATSADNNYICNVFLNSAGILCSAQSNYIFVDLSAVVLLAK